MSIGIGTDVVLFFFFKQKTAYEMRISDWSSDVCSSDLPQVAPKGRSCKRPAGAPSGCDSAGAPSRRPLRRPGHALTIARFSRFCHAFMEAYWPAELNYNYRLDWTR